MSFFLDKTCGEAGNGSVVRRCLDLPFKLFGTTISTPVSTTQDNSDKDSTNGEPSSVPGDQAASIENSSNGDHSEAKNAIVERMETDEGSCTSVKINSSSSGSSDHKVSSTEPKKKPDYKDKVLPCPRCDSLETKFCYYNNYNVNQPRHFCKNCQRYWTAGGTLRNVPVGAGRRKNKHNTNVNINNNSPAGACTFRNDHINTHGHAQSINSCFPIPIPAIESAFKSSILSFGLQNYNSNFPATGTQVLYNISKPSWRSTASTSDIGQMGIAHDSKSIETPLETDGNWQINMNANAKTSTTSSSHVCNNIWGSHQQNLLWGSALGKRSRSDHQQDTSAAILVPRTLRIDDSQEPIQNTILRNLRMEIKPESSKTSGIFKAFQSRTEESSDA